ncbi:MAG: Gfo/Idh/MocA family oxidoreductase [Fimbriimonadales bacterium]|nr:Gfo/Idh/MocA family oxidoreductase [Fimbriimonadales bacterium]
MQTVRMGVVGLGGMGLGHCRFLKESVPEAALSAVCDIRPERAQTTGEQFGVPHFTEYEAMFRSGLIDAVIIATPHYDHAPVALCAFEHGLHVLVEKPLCVSVSDGDKMIEAARRSGKKFAVGYQHRVRPEVQAARRLIEQGLLGEVRRTLLITAWYRTQAYYDSGGWRATWAGEGGGVLINQAPHFIDLWLWLGGMPHRLQGQTRTVLHDIETEDEAFALVEYPYGAHGYLYATTNEEPGENLIEICGDEGKLRLQNGELQLWKLQRPIRQFTYEAQGMWDSIPAERIEPPLEPRAEGALEGQPALIQNFARAILYNEPLVAPGEEGLGTVEIVNALILSSKRQMPVSIPVDRAAYDALLAELKAQSQPKQRLREQHATDPNLLRPNRVSSN